MHQLRVKRQEKSERRRRARLDGIARGYARYLVALALIAASLGFSSEAEAREGDRPTGIVQVSAISKVFDAYHQLTAVVVEYSENVIAPDPSGYKVIDYITPNLRDDFMRWPTSSEAPVTAVYTNNRPQMRPDRTSVNGRYVIIELEPTNHSLPANDEGVNMLNHSAAMATMRTTDPVDQCDYLRTDWSDLVVTQTVDVKNAKGEVVAPSTDLQELTNDKVKHPELNRFEQQVYVNSQGIDVHYSIYLPRTYNEGRKFPLFYYITGNGGRLNHLQRDDDGNLVNLGGPLTRDRLALTATELSENAIVVVPQLWRNAPAEWENDTTQDAIDLLENVLDQYSVDRDRVYAAGSSFGTFALSDVLAQRADLISAYVQFNGRWTDAPSAFPPEYQGRLTDKDIAYVDALPRVSTTDPAYLAQAEAVMGDVVARRIPVLVSHGVNDQTISSPSGISTYEALRALYKAEGMSDAEIDKLVMIDLYEDPAYLAMGVSERHANVPVAIKNNPQLFTWLLGIGAA
jgi:predicted peptidase